MSNSKRPKDVASFAGLRRILKERCNLSLETHQEVWDFLTRLEAQVNDDRVQAAQDGLKAALVEYERARAENIRLAASIRDLEAQMRRVSEYAEQTVNDERRARQNLLLKDSLTGVVQSGQFQGEILPRFVRDISRGRRTGDQETAASHPWAALWFLDCDKLKLINDVLGHRVGDKVLQILSKLLIGNLRYDESVIARLGGDEFGVLHTSMQRYTDTYFVADRFRESYTKYNWEEVDPVLATINVSVSVGVAVLDLRSIWGHAEEAGWIAERWLNFADQCMYKAKSDKLDQVNLKTVHYHEGQIVEFVPQQGLLEVRKKSHRKK